MSPISLIAWFALIALGFALILMAATGSLH